jgi:hypothetical protein
MKKLLSYTLGMLIMLFASCDKSETTPDVQALLTSGTWKISSVTVDGTNKNALFPNLTLTFTSAGFTATGNSPVWPASGTWTFLNSDQKAIVRSDQAEVSLEVITETELTLKMTWNKTTLGSGRVVSTKGNYIFAFSK